LRRYIGILANQYPRPVTRKELASLANVSRPAITKITERLYPVCDIKILLINKGFVLKTDKKSASQIIGAFLFTPTFGEFHRSPYVASVLDKLSLHGIISKALPEYSRFFTEQDTTFAAQLSLQVLAEGMKEMGTIELERLDQKEYAIAFAMKIGPIIEHSFSSLHRFVDQASLMQLLSFRDKLFFLFKALLEKQIRQMRILSTIDDKTASEAYIKVYLHTADFYLREAFSKFISAPIREVAQKATVPYLEEYSNIGQFFKPE